MGALRLGHEKTLRPRALWVNDRHPQAGARTAEDKWGDGGTTLRMRESGFTTAKHRDGNDEGWTEELAELVALLA